MKQLDRRSFITTLGGAALAVAGCAQAGSSAISQAGRRRLARIGIQLYSVRSQAISDLPGTLAQLAKIGYKEIEFWGNHSRSPAEIRRLLDQNGLTSPSVHVGLPANPEAWGKIFQDARVMGHQWITAPVPPSGPRATADDWKRIAGQFNDAGARAKAAGFRFAFHNHNEEVRKISAAGGSAAPSGSSSAMVAPLDLLIAQTDPALVSFELDVHWAVAGGADPIAYLSRYGNRFTMLHIKDSAGPPDFKQTDVGAGTIPFAKIIAEGERAGIAHYFVEHDGPANPMAFAKASYDYLSTLEF